MIQAAIILVIALFVAIPSIISFMQMRRGVLPEKLGWIFLSLFLRLAIAAGVLWLYFGGGVFDRVVQSVPPIRVTALVDTSSSIVTPGADTLAYGNAAADRIAEVLKRMEIDQGAVEVLAFDSSVRPLGQGLQGLRDLTPAKVAAPGQTASGLRAALASVPAASGAADAAYTLLVTDGWVTADRLTGETAFAPLASGATGGGDDELSVELLRAATQLGQPLISIPLAPAEAWRYAAPGNARIVDIGKPAAGRYVAGVESERAFLFGIGPAADADQLKTAELALQVYGRGELITEFGCRETEPRGIGLVTIPANADRLIECQPLKTIADPPGAAAQASLAIGPNINAARAILDRKGLDAPIDETMVQFLERGYVPHLLVLDGAEGETKVPAIIDSSLNSLGWRWTRLTPQQWSDARASDQPTNLHLYDAVLMADFPPGGFGVRPTDFDGDWSPQATQTAITAAMNALVDYVSLGGGLFMSGGEESFGIGGYASTAIEPLLPVQLDPKGAAGDPPIVVVGVLDVSASLWYAQETFDRAVDYLLQSFVDLPEGSQVRVLGFSDEPHELVPLQEFTGVDGLEQVLNEAFEALGEEFERRRLIGLQPEGLDVYGALAAGYRTFDRLEELAAEASLLAGDSVAALGRFGQDVEKRLFLITDAQDHDPLAYTRWSIDETGAFLRTSAQELAARRFEDQAVVLNAIGMTYGDQSLPPVEVIAQSENAQWRERYSLGTPTAIELEGLSQAAGGTSYLDTFAIPLGSLSRQMLSYRKDTETLLVVPTVNHRFLQSEDLLGQSGQVGVSGVAIAPTKRMARDILYNDYQPEFGPPVRLGIWTEWVTQAQNIRNVVSNRQPFDQDVDEAGNRGGNEAGNEGGNEAGNRGGSEAGRGQQDGTNGDTLSQQQGQTGSDQSPGFGLGGADSQGFSFGGGVSVLTTTLRSPDDSAPNFSAARLNQVAFVRMLDWLVRTRSLDEFRFTAHLAGAKIGQDEQRAADLSLQLSSAGDFAVTSAQASIWTLNDGLLRTLADEELSVDGLPLTIDDYGTKRGDIEVSVNRLDLPGAARTANDISARVAMENLEAAQNDKGAALVIFSLDGVDGRGVNRSLRYRVYVFPDQLKYRQEPASWIRGLNASLLQDLSAVAGGAYFAPGDPIALAAAPRPKAITTVSQLDIRWLIALLMIFLFVADFVVREYRIGRED